MIKNIVIRLNSILYRWDKCFEVQLSSYKYYIPTGLSHLGQNIYRTRK